jgi:uncharacterized membrane protein
MINMKNKAFRVILADGIALGLTLAVLGYILFKVIEEVRKVIAPIAEKLGIDRFLGGLTLTILALFVIFILVIILGYMMRLSVVSHFRDQLETVLLRFFPFLNRIKAMVADEIHRENATNSWMPVVLQKGGEFIMAFKIEESEHVGVFFCIKGNSPSDGETKTFKKEEYRYVHMDSIVFMQMIRAYGIGLSSFIEKKLY